MEHHPTQSIRDQRGVGVLGLLVVLFFVVVVILGGIVIIMVTRAGGWQQFLTQQAQQQELKMTPSKVVQAPPEQYRITDVVTRDDPSFGNPNAKLTIVEFGDFECPFCRQAFPTIREVMTRYRDHINFIYRDFLNPVHANAARAAEAGQCAWDEDHAKFWAFHDKLYQNQENLSADALTQYATSVGLDARRFTACLTSGRFASETQDDYRAAISLGVRGTPTWFIIYGDQIRKIEGPQDIGFWEELIETLTVQEAVPSP